MILLLPLIAGLLFLVGIYISNIVKSKKKLSNFAVALALIVLFGLIFGDLLAELKEIYGQFNIKIIITCILGIIILKFLDKLVPTHHHDHHDNEKNIKLDVSYMFGVCYIRFSFCG